MKKTAFLLLLTLISCGRDQSSGRKETIEIRTHSGIQTYSRNRFSLCSKEAYLNNCTNIVSEIRLMPYQFFDVYCFQNYRQCLNEIIL